MQFVGIYCTQAQKSGNLFGMYCTQTQKSFGMYCTQTQKSSNFVGIYCTQTQKSSNFVGIYCTQTQKSGNFAGMYCTQAQKSGNLFAAKRLVCSNLSKLLPLLPQSLCRWKAFSLVYFHSSIDQFHTYSASRGKHVKNVPHMCNTSGDWCAHLSLSLSLCLSLSLFLCLCLSVCLL